VSVGEVGAEWVVSRLEVREPPVVILDRDGTIVVDKHYLGDPAGLEFTPGAAEGLRRMRALGCRVIVITNQSGVGRGLLSPLQVFEVNRALRTMVREAGGMIEAVYVCPHLPDVSCRCRKPAPALLQQAAREGKFDAASTVVIGDKASDVDLGKRVGARTMFLSPDPTADHSADHIIAGLHEAAAILEAQSRTWTRREI
jgi:D-glycero-D-manno-heptose 1,7-bisphosphate phosphatase